MSKLVVTAVSSLIAGGLLFGTAVTSAGPGSGAKPPTAPQPPQPPQPPSPPRAPKSITVNIHDGQVQIDGIVNFVDAQIDRALHTLERDHSTPPDVRDKMRKHLEKVRDKTKKRMIKLKVGDLRFS